MRWAKLHASAVASLTIVAAILLVSVLFKYGIVSGADLVENKSLVDVLSKILGTSILTLGAIASYFRFFRGRTLSPRLKIDAKVDVYPASQGSNLHILSVEVTNIGAVSVWGLRPSVRLIRHGPDGDEEEGEIRRWWEPMAESGDAGKLRVVDTEESEQYVVQRTVPKTFYAVTYCVGGRLESGQSWSRVVTASNRVSAAE